jgi:dTDP-4-dehydrorhamnose reductase
VVDDQVGSPTATVEVSEAICDLLRARPQGIFHFAAGGYVSRYAMAKFVLAKLNMNADVVPCRTCEYPTPARRPLNSRFGCGKIAPLLARPIEDWQIPLERFLRQL